MLYDRIVDNKEVGKKIWKICTTLNDLYYVEWYVLRWMICITLSDLYYAERFELRWMICTALNYLHRVGLFVVQHLTICTALNGFYYIEWFVLRWIICTTSNDFLLRCKICTSSNNLYSQGVERFVLRLIVDYRLFKWVSGVLIRANTVRYFA